ncbi:MAG: magnesium transporter [Bdellovibrionales bacterium]|nr:magnesium transporter [Bdellovibrionales bacterium]
MDNFNSDESSSWSALTLTERRERFSSIPRTEAEELFLSLNTHDQAELISESPQLEKRSWIRLLAPDDAADLIQEMGADHKEELLALLDPQTRREVTALLAYAEDNAGGLMSSRYARLRPDMSVDEAISYLRIQSRTQVETIYYAYVLDSDQTLLGVVSFRELFSASPGKRVKDIMKSDLIKIPVDLDQEQIGQVFSQQNLMALPVIDTDGHMKGIVTFDDIATAIQEEATEDILKLGAVETLDAPYFKTSLLEMIKKRGGWLVVLFVGEMFTATAMAYFQVEIERPVVLALFIPLIISSGGNSGSQASTLIIRAMALGEVRLKDWWRVLVREILTGLSLGAFLGLLGMFRIMIWPSREEVYGAHYGMVALTVAASIIGVVLWGTITGSMLPFALRKLKFEPASASAPAVATLVDVTGLIIYFTMASLILKGVLL